MYMHGIIIFLYIFFLYIYKTKLQFRYNGMEAWICYKENELLQFVNLYNN